ncbi:MAG: M20/M25/M40 family metallo-hydrolase [Ignavibacteria bacterium]|nr:M20/M25/M40 family metallo-hydrolase [Ignavibacteria bacterium]MCU7502250.1 M20/M25/M40 family metallo-hydrolase [Ignavibacteria bacterium]MCU7516706.1 M20/M25/M40 family metallo-hydrolase [Ignavibacteria bacterium]
MKPNNNIDTDSMVGLSPHLKLARSIFSELININTTQNNGSTKAAEAMHERLKQAGFPESDMHLTGPKPQNMNLVVRYPGTGKLRPVLFIVHMDVVEAIRSDWSFDPFNFTEKDGYFYGRGACDIKNEAADIIANLIRLKAEGFMPERDIIVALTEHEESGDANGVKWILENRPDLIEAEFAINLDAGGGSIVDDRPQLLEIQTGEKTFANFKLEAHNKGGHSSLPVKDNAIYRLAAALTRLAKFDFPIQLNDTTRMFFQRALETETEGIKEDIEAILKTPLDSQAAERLAELNPYYNAVMRTTCVATLLNGGHADNALPQTAAANINCRMLPGDTPEDVLKTLKSVVSDPMVEITCTYTAVSSPISAIREDLMAIAEQIASSMWPGVKVTPFISTGATDGKHLRNAGIPVYGVSGMFLDMKDMRAHGKDERIGVKEFYDGVGFMYQFVKAISRKAEDIN